MQVFEQNICPERMAAYQLRLLNAQLAYAASHSRFYAGWDIRPLTGLAEISRLPFTTAEDIMERGNELICVPASRVQRIVSLRSSGTEGPWKRLHFSANDLEQTVAFFAQGMKHLCAPGDSVMICMPGIAEDGIGQLLAQGLERLGAEPLLYGPIDNYGQAAAYLRQACPHTVVGIPAQMRRLALAAPDSAPVNVLLSADRIGPQLRRTIERVWGCEVFEHYGLTESGLGGAVECPSHQGLHIRHDALYMEIVEPDGDRPLPPGSWGEIVLTTLNREAMPLLRYRTGDMGRLLTGPCGCGSLLPRLDSIKGRLKELSHPLSIYALDDILLADDSILDYSAQWRGDLLCFRVAGDEETARALLQRSFPGQAVEVAPGPGFLSTGTRKRSIL